MSLSYICKFPRARKIQETMPVNVTETRISELKDKVFEADKKISDFAFNKEVATVFDDMVSRSVPYYDEMQRMTVELVRDFAVDDTNIYDIGCATGTTMALIDRYIGETKVNLVGIDNSQELLDKARKKTGRASCK